MNVLIVASSSGGHVYPAFELGKYLSKCGYNVTYLGIKGQIEERIFPVEKTNFIELPKAFKLALKKPFKLKKTYFQTAKIIKNKEIIIGFGGFITFFVSLLPKIKSKYFYLHEANIDIGDSNLHSLRKARRLFTSFLDTSHKKYRNKIVYTGNPIFHQLTPLKEKRQKITFVFGSLGAKTMLDQVVKFIKETKIKEEYRIITSKKYYQEVINELKSFQNVEIIEYINHKELYGKSSLLFCRGGASTLASIVATLTPSVCIPSPYVKHHHQERNALYFKKHNAIRIIEEKYFNTESIEREIIYYQKEKGKIRIEALKNMKNIDPCLQIYLKIKHDTEDCQ